LKKVAGFYTLLASTGTEKETSIDRLLRLRLDVEGFTVSVYFGDELLLRTADAAISDATRFSRSFERIPDPVRVETLRRSAEQLRANREPAFFGTVPFSKEDAEAAVLLMKSALSEARAFVTLTE